MTKKRKLPYLMETPLAVAVIAGLNKSMRLVSHIALLLMLLVLANPALGDVFALRNGKEVEGAIMRTEGSRVTIRTPTGISSYDVNEFSEDTRDKYFAGAQSVPEPSKRVSLNTAEPGVDASSPANDSGQSKLGLGLAVVGVALMIVGSIWFIVAGFAESPLWGIALLLFNGIAGLAFLLLHWDRAMSPVLTWLLGLGLIIGAAVFCK